MNVIRMIGHPSTLTQSLDCATYQLGNQHFKANHDANLNVEGFYVFIIYTDGYPKPYKICIDIRNYSHRAAFEQLRPYLPRDAAYNMEIQFCTKYAACEAWPNTFAKYIYWWKENLEFNKGQFPESFSTYVLRYQGQVNHGFTLNCDNWPFVNSDPYTNTLRY